jgi:hypothetical protein
MTALRFLDVDVMVRKEPPPVPWLAGQVLPRGALTAIYAPGGDGKSLLMLALAAAIAHAGAAIVQKRTGRPRRYCSPCGELVVRAQRDAWDDQFRPGRRHESPNNPRRNACPSMR